MNEKRLIITIVCALAASVPVAAAAGDPLAQPTSDLSQLTADANSAGSTVTADGKSGDLARLKRDAKAGNGTLKADWKLLLTDVTAARKAGGDKVALRSLMQAARSQLKGFRSVVRAAFAQARQTAKQNKGSHGSKGKGEHSGQGSDDDGSGG